METVKKHTVKEFDYFNRLVHYTVYLKKDGSKYSVFYQYEGEAKKIDDRMFYCGGVSKKNAYEIFNYKAYGKLTIKGI